MSNTHEVALPTTDITKTKEGQENTWICPEFKVSGIFSSHMVLQREKPIRVWGFSTHVGTEVTGRFMGETASAVVGEDNRFALCFAARPACAEGQTMTVADAFGHEAVFEDILIGDVWIIGGQSNAELHLAPCMPFTPDAVFDENDNFRLFYQHGWSGMEYGKEKSGVSPDIIHPDWVWQRPDKESSLNFSAIGWSFAKELIQQIPTPIGVVMMASGGVCLRELMPIELADAFGYTEGANTRIAGCYDSLIHPLLPLAFKAQIFFQGESEGCWLQYADKYDTDLAAFFADERARFGQPFPVYNVQLSEYGENCKQYFPYLDIVRVKQFDALSQIEEMTLTVDMDLGIVEGYDWAHSPRKAELAKRLAALALAKEYGIGNVDDAMSPAPVSAVLSKDAQEICIAFKDVGTGLIGKGEDAQSIAGFTVGPYADRKEAKATIVSSDRIVVKVPEGADARFVNYCFAINVAPELYNGNDLPCPAFSLPVNG